MFLQNKNWLATLTKLIMFVKSLGHKTAHIKNNCISSDLICGATIIMKKMGIETNKIQTAMLISAALIEGVALFAVVVCLLISFRA